MDLPLAKGELGTRKKPRVPQTHSLDGGEAQAKLSKCRSTQPRGWTERTRRFRAGELSEADARPISYVEQFGCSIVQVKRSGAGLGWSYTVGVYDTADKPEIITVGLREGTAHTLLNEAAERLRACVDLTQGPAAGPPQPSSKKHEQH